jgi:hypothetical protein
MPCAAPVISAIRNASPGMIGYSTNIVTDRFGLGSRLVREPASSPWPIWATAISNGEGKGPEIGFAWVWAVMQALGGYLTGARNASYHRIEFDFALFVL